MRHLVLAERASLVCLQETKMEVINDYTLMQIVGAGFDYNYLSAARTCDGILVAWKSSMWSFTNINMRTYSLSGRLKQLAGDVEMWLTVVYVPSRDEDKAAFLAELHDLSRVCHGPWLLAGDFNLIYRVQDKNNTLLNRRRMGQFRRFIMQAELKEIHLNGRLYTWSNKRAHPTLEQIDRIFTTADWELLYPHSDLQPLSSICSDHAPLLLRTNNVFSYKKRFHFTEIWTWFLGFHDVVRRAWSFPLRNADPFKRLDWPLRNTARVLQSWSAKQIGSIRLQLELAKEVVHRLEIARDHRALAEHEENLRRTLKLKSLGLSSLQRSIARQESHLSCLAEGDIPTKFFHIQANIRRRKKFIKSLEHEGTVHFDEEEKVSIAYQFFNSLLGTPPTRTHVIDLERLGIPVANLSGLDDRFMEHEVWSVIKELHSDKSPGPDSFTARFLQATWDIIRPDIMSAFDSFWHLDNKSFHVINDATLVLLPKSQEASSIKGQFP